MCLELCTTLLNLPFAWLGLAVLAALASGLTCFLLGPSKRGSAQRQSSGFICPCYAPPASPTEDEQ